MNIENYQESAKYILDICTERPETAVVLGSGLGSLTQYLEDVRTINYTDIPHFPAPTNKSHSGKMHIGKMNGKQVVMMSGRYHSYEGYTLSETVIPIRVLKLAGIKNLILTNAAGAVNEDFCIGDIMMITDHIKFTEDSPEKGIQPPEFGDRFFGMNDAYCKDTIKKVTKEFTFVKNGVYFFSAGPQFETPAEIRAVRILGGDAVGMSTAPEVITASKLKIKTAAFSCITNLAAGMSETEPNDDEVVENGKLFKDPMRKIISYLIENM